jgi:5'-3' exonuclease
LGFWIYKGIFEFSLGGLEVVSLEKILEETGWGLEQLVNFGILCGTDYNANPKGVGPMTAQKLIDEFGTIERILEEKEGGAKKLQKFDFSGLGLHKEIVRNFMEDFKGENLDVRCEFVDCRLLSDMNEILKD